MTTGNWQKAFTQLDNKPVKKAKFIKHCQPKKRVIGQAVERCERCGRFAAHIKSYGLNLCRHCFRDIAEEIGFKKYN